MIVVTFTTVGYGDFSPVTVYGQLVSMFVLIYVYDDDDDEARKPYPANNVEPGHAHLHLNQINRVKCQVSSGGGANRKRR